MAGDQRLELADHVAVPAQGELGFDAPLERGEAQLLETGALVAGELLRELGQRRPAPQPERVPQELGRLRRISLIEFAPALGDETLEAGEIELILTDLEEVAGRTGVEPRLGQRLPELRDVDLHHLLSGLGHVVPPELVDDPVAGDGVVRAQEQHCQQCPLLARGERQRLRAVDDFERAEKPKLHARSAKLARRREQGRCRVVLTAAAQWWRLRQGRTDRWSTRGPGSRRGRARRRPRTSRRSSRTASRRRAWPSLPGAAPGAPPARTRSR